ncbi:MAG TPA: CDP-alcohol phosphatidyltransferase family protein [Calidithermus sp.]|nr:CDP-alcohol phosphatidyltransferase family protein [Calidithermus sp.]
MNLPNSITLARLCLVPVVALLVLQERYGWALAAFAVAGASDAVDGFLARALGQRTALGALLDPAADKLLLVSTFATLWWVERLPGWLLGLVFGRDALLAGGYWGLYAAGRRLPVKPTPLGKLTMAAQLVLAGWLLWVAARADQGRAPGWLVGLAVGLTIGSGLHYAWVGSAALRRGGGGP